MCDPMCVSVCAHKRVCEYGFWPLRVPFECKRLVRLYVCAYVYNVDGNVSMGISSPVRRLILVVRVCVCVCVFFVCAI